VSPPTLVLWGKNDRFFSIAGARAFLRDVPNAELDLVDGSHFLLETHGPLCGASDRPLPRSSSWLKPALLRMQRLNALVAFKAVGK
jgi:hypothetical protein